MLRSAFSAMFLDEQQAKQRIAALPPGNQPRIKWAGFDLPGEIAEGNLLVVGGVGTGKSLMHRELMHSIVPHLLPGSNRKMLIYDVKCDLLSTLCAMPLVSEVLIFNPLDERSVAWDLAADIKTPSQVREFTESLIRPQDSGNQPFFTEYARAILELVINSLNRTQPGHWSLRRLIQITATRERLERVLTPADLQHYSLPAQAYANGLATIVQAMLKFEPIAALWERTPRKISLEHWAHFGESILILGSTAAMMAPLRAINDAACKTISESLLSEPDAPRPSRFWFFCDDLTIPGRLCSLPAWLNAHSKGVHCTLAFQDFEGLAATYQSNEAAEIVSQCATKSWLKLSNPETAEWASRLTGMALHSSEFLNLPPYRSGNVSGVHFIKELDAPIKSTAHYEFTKATTVDFEPRPSSDEFLPPWSDSDDQWLYGVA